MLLSEVGRIHTIKNDKIKPRGAPEVPARAFDSSDADRSEMKKLENTEFKVVDYDADYIDWSRPESEEIPRWGDNNIRITVKSDAKDPKYHGVDLIFILAQDAPEVMSLEEDDIDFSGEGNIAAYQIKNLKAKMIKTCVAAIRAGKVTLGEAGKVSIAKGV